MGYIDEYAIKSKPVQLYVPSTALLNLVELYPGGPIGFPLFQGNVVVPDDSLATFSHGTAYEFVVRIIYMNNITAIVTIQLASEYYASTNKMLMISADDFPDTPYATIGGIPYYQLSSTFAPSVAELDDCHIITTNDRTTFYDTHIDPSDHYYDVSDIPTSTDGLYLVDKASEYYSILYGVESGTVVPGTFFVNENNVTILGTTFDRGIYFTNVTGIVNLMMIYGLPGKIIPIDTSNYSNIETAMGNEFGAWLTQAIQSPNTLTTTQLDLWATSNGDEGQALYRKLAAQFGKHQAAQLYIS